MIYCEGVNDPTLCSRCDLGYCPLSEEDKEYSRNPDEWDAYVARQDEYESYCERFGNYWPDDTDNFYDGETDELIDALKEYQNQEWYYKKLISTVEANTTAPVERYEAYLKEKASRLFEELRKQFTGECA